VKCVSRRTRQRIIPIDGRRRRIRNVVHRRVCPNHGHGFEAADLRILGDIGVLAIVLGLALETTLADVFSGLAINIERPFGAGASITVNDNVAGQIIEIDLRATRMRTFANDMVVIPNCVIAKAIVTNHHKLNEPYISSLSLKIDSAVSSARVIKALESAASASLGIASGNTARTDKLPPTAPAVIASKPTSPPRLDECASRYLVRHRTDRAKCLVLALRHCEHLGFWPQLVNLSTG
jgi:small-conductance mechanosensitive channel